RGLGQHREDRGADVAPTPARPFHEEVPGLVHADHEATAAARSEAVATEARRSVHAIFHGCSSRTPRRGRPARGRPREDHIAIYRNRLPYAVWRGAGAR